MAQFSREFIKLLLVWRWVVFILLGYDILAHGYNVGVLVLAGLGYAIATALALYVKQDFKVFVNAALDLGVACFAGYKIPSEMAWLTFTLPPLELIAASFYAGVGGVLTCMVAYPALARVRPGGDGDTVSIPLHLGVMVLVFVTAWTYSLLVRQGGHAQALVKVIESSQELGTSANLETLLSGVVEEVQKLLDCNTVVAYLKDTDPASNLVKAAQKSGPHPEAFSNFDPEVAQSIVGQVMKERKAAIIDDFQQVKDGVITPAKEFRAVMVAPLLFEGNALGALFIASSKPKAYDVANVKLFQMLANQVALAVRNIQLQQTTALLAITDSLSGLYTHGYFQESLGKELVKAKYANQPISLMILDVDFFKKVNDTYGHPQGDALLKQLGSVIKQATRPQDVICRYGGDEFTVTMLNTNRIGAVVVAERIRQMVEEYEFVLDGKIVHITISGGVSSFPEDAQSKKELVETSDHAMYEAKSKGRNRICFGS